MNRVLFGAAALLSGLLLFCTKVEASSDILPKAGFQEFIDEIECERIEPTYYISDYEADLLLRIGVLEAGGLDVDGIAEVMQVVMNRVESDEFPDSIEEVLFQAGQFTTADKLASANITPEAYAALDCVIFGDYQHNEAHFFESCDGLIWGSIYDYQFSYGGHDFYKCREEQS